MKGDGFAIEAETADVITEGQTDVDACDGLEQRGKPQATATRETANGREPSLTGGDEIRVAPALLLEAVQ